MLTDTLEATHTLGCQLSADAVDTAHGIIRGCTVAKAGVQATGKFVMLDARGQITRDPDLMASEVPVFTDETTLTTLMTAAAAAGERIKVRHDHVDELGARAGYVDSFTKTNDGRVVADLHLFQSYGLRALTLETAIETPEELGLSIDFTPYFELRDGKAMMRVSELHAVDIVDEGAITRDGLLLSAGVDTGRKVENRSTKMPSPTPEEIMSAIGSLTETVGKLTSSLTATQEAVTKLSAKTEEKPADKSAETLSAVKDLSEKFTAVQAQVVQLKREKALLGFRGTSEERAKLATAQPEEIEKAVIETKPKSYMELVAARVESAKCKRSEAHRWVMQNHKDAHTAHLAAKGVIRFAA